MKMPSALGTGVAIASILNLAIAQPGHALPPPDELPEEVARTEIILGARSPVDGEPLTAAEYAELQAQLQESAFAPAVSPVARELIFLLRVRELLNTLVPLVNF
ncbi:MAG: hypothetical protein HC838_06930 [Spirulinaceae cyanobacterium RM2_2_10]|nr:hypothetical protein [Spirulinaceae cyanobacterium SM2_1_0]NJO19845.1 hypothetical protein [Spirulinaceae cyanobacterium RM2_2_10]